MIDMGMGTSDQDGWDTCDRKKNLQHNLLFVLRQRRRLLFDTGIWHLGSIAIQLEQKVGMDKSDRHHSKLGRGRGKMRQSIN